MKRVRDPVAVQTRDSGRSEERGKKNISSVVAGLEAFNDQNFDLAIADFRSDMVWFSDTLPHPLKGPEAIKQGIKEVFRIFPGVAYSLANVFASGNLVSSIMNVRGNRINGFLGLPPVEKPFEFTELAVNQFDDDGYRIATWTTWNQVHLLQEMGIIPASFAGKRTVILGHDYSPRWGDTTLDSQASSESEPLPTIKIPPGVDPYTYKIKTVTKAFDQVVSFTLSLHSDSAQKVEVDKRGNSTEIRAQLHHLGIEPGTRVGCVDGRASLTWKIIPEDFVASPGVEAPAISLDPTRSQRCILEGHFEFADVLKSGFYGFGTGRTWPSIHGDPQLLLGTIMEILRGHGKFKDLTGTVVTNGYLVPPSTMKLEVLVRARDPSGDLRATVSSRVARPTSGTSSGTTSFLFRGEMNPKNPVSFILGSNGQFLGAHGHELLRLSTVTWATRGRKGLRSQTRSGTVVGEMNFKVYFDAFQKSSPIPFQTRYATLDFCDSKGAQVGTLDANIVEGRAFPTRLPDAPMEVFQMGSLAPVTGGTGLFEGASGLVSVSVWLSILPRAIDSLVLIELWDPDGQYRAATEKVWDNSLG